jgi:1-acyl-sn-glycerol-3-phosphate acyltransferase
MIRRIIVALVRLALRIYFKRIEVAGLEHVPLDTPVIFVLNHPNALVDPVFLLCLAPRQVSFLAKAPLFRMPVLGYLVRELDSLPVYRRQDEGEDVTRNQETFIAARKLLERGGTIGICSEGVSHDEPGLKPIKTRRQEFHSARYPRERLITCRLYRLDLLHFEDEFSVQRFCILVNRSRSIVLFLITPVTHHESRFANFPIVLRQLCVR